MRNHTRSSILSLAALGLGVGVLPGCGGTQTPATGSGAGGIALGTPSSDVIPRATLFGNPDRVAAQISPDGTQLSFLAPVDGVLNVWVAPVGALEQARSVTADTKRPVRRYFWAYTNQHIIYSQDQGGDENWHVYSVDLTSGKTTDLTPLPKVQARIAAVSHKHPDHILVELNDRDPRYHDIHKVDIRTGERELVLQNPGMAGFHVDDDYRVRLANNVTPDGGSVLRAPDGKGGWKEFLKIGQADSLTTGFITFDNTDTGGYLWDSRDRNTRALFHIDLATGDKKLIAEDPRADGSGLMFHPTEYTVQAVSFTYEKREWKVLDPEVQTDLDALRKVSDGELTIVDTTLANDKWIAAFHGDTIPVRYYLWDRTAQQATFLFVNRKALEGLPLAPMHPEVIKSRDGLDLVSYLTLPNGSTAAGAARPTAPQPMVLLVHGGPWGRDNWGYNPLHQLLANRGYAVLSVNFRASTGFGKAFTNAGDGQWGKKMHEDLIDAVNWAVSQNIALKDKVCIMGGSYGGYATLAGLTFTPDVFACGVDIVGPSSIITLLESIPPYWKPLLDVFKTRVGDWNTVEGKAMLLDRSPLTHVDKIQRPLLIGQGANDPRVKQAESDQIVAAMKKKNIPVTYVLFPDEGHGFARTENNMAFFAIAEAFLSAHLGGVYQPLTADDFAGSSIQIRDGANGIPGLPAGVGQ